MLIGSSGSTRCSVVTAINRSVVGIRTALPYVDYFLPAHNLESLAQLTKVLIPTLVTMNSAHKL